MKRLSFEFQHTCLIEPSEIFRVGKALFPEIKKIAHHGNAGYQSEYASIQLSGDAAIAQAVQNVVEQKRTLQPSTLLLIGIGGSNLGTLAIHQALHGNYYQEKKPTLKFYCADTVDSDGLADLLYLIEQELRADKNVVINVVTKSGTTTETIVNFELFLALLKKYRPHNFAEYVVVTTDAGSAFAAFSREHQFTTLEIPSQVGGRYSVFSFVGLFPLCMLGVDIQHLCAGAQQAIAMSTSGMLEHNPAAISAILKYLHYQQGIHINDLFLFDPKLTLFGQWYRQLMGESIGKEFNHHQKKVEIGITPTVSIGSVDLHSVGQLYLGGPRDKFTSFVVVDSPKTAVQIPQMPEFEQFVRKIQGKNVSTIMDAIFQGTQAAYVQRQRPFCTIRIPEISAQTIGQLLQMHMIEMMYLGALFEVNPFDQPNVESYKKVTREILTQSAQL